METITIKVNKTVTEQKELKLPYYTKWECDGKVMIASKIFSPEQCIHVSNCGGAPQIQIAHAGLAIANGSIEGTQDEFEALLSSISADLLLIGYTNKESKAA